MAIVLPLLPGSLFSSTPKILAPCSVLGTSPHNLCLVEACHTSLEKTLPSFVSSTRDLSVATLGTTLIDHFDKQQCIAIEYTTKTDLPEKAIIEVVHAF